MELIFQSETISNMAFLLWYLQDAGPWEITIIFTVTEQRDLYNCSDYDLHLWDQEGDNFPKLLDNELKLLGLFYPHF